MKKIPMRSCVVTKEKLPKRELLRIVKNNENKVFVDLTGKANGRGAYIKADKSVIDKAKKSKVLDRHLEVSVPDTIYEELVSIVENR